jgi:hypothetical protein
MQGLVLGPEFEACMCVIEPFVHCWADPPSPPPPTSVPLQDLREKLGNNHRESKKAAKALLEVQQRIPQVTAELQKLEARRSGGAAGAAGGDASAALRAELRQLEARRVEAGKKVTAKQAQLATIEAEVADLQVGGWVARCRWWARCVWVAGGCSLLCGHKLGGLLSLMVCGACLLWLPSSSATADAAPIPAAAAASPTGAHR